jgi:hypothetical protein
MGAITFLAPPVLILEPVITHTFAPICDFSRSKMTHTPTFEVEITQFAVKNWPGVSGFTPLLLFTRLSEYAILNYLATFSNPKMFSNPKIKPT